MTWRDDATFQQGRNGEKIVARLLQQEGWGIVPSYDYSGETNDKAPRLQFLRSGLVIPDLDASHLAYGRIWVEVKTNSEASWYIIGQQYQHGIREKHWNDYIEVQRITRTPVWLYVYQLDNQTIYKQAIDILIQHPHTRTGTHKRHGKNAGTYVYFNRDAFIVWKTSTKATV